MPTKQKPNNDKTQLPYQITAAADGKTVEVLIYDVIGQTWDGEGVTAKSFMRDMQGFADATTIVVRINSPGGSVFDGLAIYNALREHKAEKRGYVDGLAGSMASVIAMACNTLTMYDNALMFVHHPQGGVFGNAKSMRDMADMLDKATASIIKAYVDKSGQSEDEIRSLLDREAWLDAEEAFELGLIDATTEQMQLAAHFTIDDVQAHAVVPDDMRERIESVINKKTLKGDEMPKPQTETPVTIEQLESMKGATPEFVLAQLKSNATLEDSLLSLNAMLHEKLTASATQIEELTGQLAEAKTKAAEAAKNVVNVGVDPIQGNARTEGDDKQEPWGNDPIGFYKQEFSKCVAEANGNSVKAAQMLDKKYPALADALAPTS